MLQGQIIINKLKKEEVEVHAAKIREQYHILEQFLTENKYMAGDHVNKNISLQFVLLIFKWIKNFVIVDDNSRFVNRVNC